jgi:beta-N-acetylglucosaminidase
MTEENKIVSIFDKKYDKKVEKKKEDKKEDTEMSFEEIQERNRKNKERVEQERLKANKGVLRSYRIKY